tara:strand:- start:66 stop:605 length:540 start_codon:yes stop_codon:yes gene_type:complete
MLDLVFDIAFRSALAAILITAAWHKLRDPIGFWQIVASYRIVPEALTRYVARLVPIVEIATAVCLVAIPSTAMPVFAAAFLWLVYAGAIVVNLLRGQTDIECGCGGVSADQKIHWGLVVRNGVLLMGTLALLLPTSARAITWFDYGTAGFAALILLSTYATAEHLLRNAALLDHEGTHP